MSEPVIVHVEARAGAMFCGETDDSGVLHRVWWANETEAVQLATCEGCLLKLYMLGDSARIALARMGRVVQVHDVGEVS